jgi:hypothetical protein
VTGGDALKRKAEEKQLEKAAAADDPIAAGVAALLASKQASTSAAWLEAAEKVFAELQPPHLEKKRATILALVDARLSQRSEETVWKREDTCSRNTWHSKWKHDPVITGAVDAVQKLATGWRDAKMLQALQDAAEKLALASPLAAMVAAQKLMSGDDKVALRAAFGILDRADFSTATKASHLAADMDDLLTDEEQAAVEEALRKAAGNG